MAERESRSEALRLGTPLLVGAVTLLPVERDVVHAMTGGSGVWCSAAKEPYAIVVREGDGVRAVGIGAAEVSPEELKANVPGLDALLASWNES